MRYYSLVLSVLMLASSVAKEGVLAQDVNCLNQLRPCLAYLNNDRNDPPATCCSPLKAVIKSDPACLCQMMSNRGASVAEQAGINITEAQKLPGKCGQNIDLLACISGSGSSRNSVRNSAADLRRNLAPGLALITVMVMAMIWI